MLPNFIKLKNLENIHLTISMTFPDLEKVLKIFYKKSELLDKEYPECSNNWMVSEVNLLKQALY